MAAITALGLMVWIERRRHGNEGGKSARFYDRLSHLNTGTVMGLAVATIAIFHLDKLYAGAEATRIIWTGWTYFGVWALGLAYAFVRRNDYATTKELMALAGGLALAVPLMNGAVTGDWVWLSLGEDHTVSACVDVCMAVLGALTLAVAAMLPEARTEKAAARAAASQAPVAAELRSTISFRRQG